MQADLFKEFRNRFQKDPEYFFFCPGRVNLIGEHIDYNGGRVMPAAISLGTYLAVAKNTDKLLRFQCLNFPQTADIPLQARYTKSGKAWFNYPLGIIDNLGVSEHHFSGLDMLFYGNLPIGAGLSSSASIEVLTAFAMNELFSLGLSTQQEAVLSQKVENEFIGVNCGIMDQFAVAMGKKNKAILLDCDTLKYEYLPFESVGYTLAIINSKKQRSLAESRYNERFAECRAALEALRKELNADNLCAISLRQFEEHRRLVANPVLVKRALHVIGENERVSEAVKALHSGDIIHFGRLMYASHESLKELYEVSGKELDTIVDFCKADDNCIGARMTGAGFGGCAIALVRENGFDDFAKRLSAFYQQVIGYQPEVFASEIGDGVRVLQV